MIVELGHFALILALAVALIQSTVPVWGARAGDDRWPWPSPGRTAAW